MPLDPGALDNLDPQALMDELNKFLCSKNQNKKRTIKFDHSGGEDPVNGRISQVIEEFSKKMTEIISQRTEQGSGDLFRIEERTTDKEETTERLEEGKASSQMREGEVASVPASTSNTSKKRSAEEMVTSPTTPTTTRYGRTVYSPRR